MDDRISTLPDPILCHILSFLPTKQTVATSVLSKRWKPLWRSVPALDFDDHEANRIGTYFRFVQSVYVVIVSRDLHQPINRFRLSCLSDYFYEPYNVSVWVNAAVLRRVQHIELCVYPECIRPSPNLSSIFTCDTLVVLKLQGMKLEGLPSVVDLPLLKVLHLQYLTISEFKSLAELLSGCPNLEDLKARGLFITCYKSYREFKTLPKLVRADISLESSYILFRDVVDNVKFLHLDEIYVGVLNESARQYPDFLPMFHNLTHIELVYSKFNNDCSEVVELLNRCPKLQDLVINQPNIKYDQVEELEDLQYPSSVPECVLSHLQRCYINGYRGTKGEFRFAKYIMENGMFLKSMTISSGIAGNLQRKRKMLKKLSSCTRQSATCKLSFK